MSCSNLTFRWVGRLGARINYRDVLLGGTYSVEVSGLARMVARDQGIVPQNSTEVQGPLIHDHRPRILVRRENLLREFVEAESVGADDFELAVLWAA